MAPSMLISKTEMAEALKRLDRACAEAQNQQP
jgi:hypothetical protein